MGCHKSQLYSMTRTIWTIDCCTIRALLGIFWTQSNTKISWDWGAWNVWTNLEIYLKKHFWEIITGQYLKFKWFAKDFEWSSWKKRALDVSRVRSISLKQEIVSICRMTSKGRKRRLLSWNKKRPSFWTLQGRSPTRPRVRNCLKKCTR